MPSRRGVRTIYPANSPLFLIGTSLAFAVLMLSAPRPVLGQSTGTITGTVTDAQGAAIVGTSVVVRNVETAIERTFATSETGSYTAPLLQPGTYDITATQSGFATVERKAVRLQVGQT